MSILFVISAPSGTGKSTILRDARRTDPRLTFSRSYTTRAPRGPELDGVDYYFTTKEDFEARAGRGGVSSWSTPMFSGTITGRTGARLSGRRRRAATWSWTSTCRVRDNYGSEYLTPY